MHNFSENELRYLKDLVNEKSTEESFKKELLFKLSEAENQIKSKKESSNKALRGSVDRDTLSKVLYAEYFPENSNTPIGGIGFGN